VFCFLGGIASLALCEFSSSPVGIAASRQSLVHLAAHRTIDLTVLSIMALRSITRSVSVIAPHDEISLSATQDFLSSKKISRSANSNAAR